MERLENLFLTTLHPKMSYFINNGEFFRTSSIKINKIDFLYVELKSVNGVLTQISIFCLVLTAYLLLCMPTLTLYTGYNRDRNVVLFIHWCQTYFVHGIYWLIKTNDILPFSFTTNCQEGINDSTTEHFSTHI